MAFLRRAFRKDRFYMIKGLTVTFRSAISLIVVGGIAALLLYVLAVPSKHSSGMVASVSQSTVTTVSLPPGASAEIAANQQAASNVAPGPMLETLPADVPSFSVPSGFTENSARVTSSASSTEEAVAMGYSGSGTVSSVSSDLSQSLGTDGWTVVQSNVTANSAVYVANGSGWQATVQVSPSGSSSSPIAISVQIVNCTDSCPSS